MSVSGLYLRSQKIDVFHETLSVDCVISIGLPVSLFVSLTYLVTICYMRYYCVHFTIKKGGGKIPNFLTFLLPYQSVEEIATHHIISAWLHSEIPPEPGQLHKSLHMSVFKTLNIYFKITSTSRKYLMHTLFSSLCFKSTSE